MTGKSADPFIDVDQLKVGMFIHLDLGWMDHPFPLSSFKLSSQEQIATVRGLGVKQVRWSPGKSDLQADAATVRGDSAEGLVHAPSHQQLQASTDEADQPARLSSRVRNSSAGREPEPELSTQEQTKKACREQLRAQRDALNLCERQYAEASHAYRGLIDLALRQPGDSRDQAQALTKALLDKMLGDSDLSIRLLGEGAGDRTTAHALNVSIISLLLARAFNMPAEEMMDLGVGAMLHDIGKLDLPARVRYRDDSLSSAEMELHQTHVAKGVAIGQKMGLGSGPLLVIAQHHENADGTGFPQRLNADRMSAAARIVSLVNRFDGLCNPSVPAKAMTPHEALSLMFAQGRSRFDATMLNAFIRMMGVYPPGSIVQLTDDRFAIVVAVNSSRPLKPRVMVHDPRTAPEDALILNLEEQENLGIRRSLKPAMLPADARNYLSPRQRVAYFFEPAIARPETYQELAA
jgi:putative nucleotidyltransferase with HDIG domain